MKFELYLDEIWHRPNKTTQILEKSDFNFFKAFKKWIPELNFFQKPVSKAGKKQFYILKKMTTYNAVNNNFNYLFHKIISKSRFPTRNINKTSTDGRIDDSEQKQSSTQNRI